MSTERTKTEITVELSILDSILESDDPVAQTPTPTPTPTTPTPDPDDEPVDWQQLTKIMLRIGKSERTAPKQKRKIRFCGTCGEWNCNIHPVEVEID